MQNLLGLYWPLHKRFASSITNMAVKEMFVFRFYRHSKIEMIKYGDPGKSFSTIWTL